MTCDYGINIFGSLQEHKIIAYFKQDAPTNKTWRILIQELKDLIPGTVVQISASASKTGVRIYWNQPRHEVQCVDIGANGFTTAGIDAEAWGRLLAQTDDARRDFSMRVWAHFADAPNGTVTGEMLKEARLIEEAVDGV